MKHRLAGVPVTVQDRPVSGVRMTLFPRDGGCTPDHFTNQRLLGCGEVVECCDVASRDDQNVQWSLGVDVPEGHQPIVLVDERGGDPPGRNLTEQTVGHGNC